MLAEHPEEVDAREEKARGPEDNPDHQPGKRTI
jgi:hypothetical protein